MSAGPAESPKANEKNYPRCQDDDEQNCKNWHDHGDPLPRTLSDQRKHASGQYPA